MTTKIGNYIEVKMKC